RPASPSTKSSGRERAPRPASAARSKVTVRRPPREARPTTAKRWPHELAARSAGRPEVREPGAVLEGKRRKAKLRRVPAAGGTRLAFSRVAELFRAGSGCRAPAARSSRPASGQQLKSAGLPSVQDQGF